MTWKYDESQRDNAAFLRQFIAFLQSCVTQSSQHAESVRPEFVPSQVRVPFPIRSEAPFLFPGKLNEGVYTVTSNQWGAISAIADNGKLMGIKPHLKRNQEDT